MAFQKFVYFVSYLFVMVCFAMQLLLVADETELKNLPPSKREFVELNKKISELVSGEKKDYKSAFTLMVEFCKKYPASTSARFAANNASIWRTSGFITKDEFAVIVDIMQKADPAKKEMDKIKTQLEKAMSSSDTRTLKEIADQLENIVQKFPNTQSSYNAASALPHIYKQVGETEKSKIAGELFLKKYPPEKTDQSGYMDRTVDILIEQANSNEPSEAIKQMLDILERHDIKSIRYFEIARSLLALVQHNVVPKELEERVIAKLSKDYDDRANVHDLQYEPYKIKGMIADFYIGKHKNYTKAKEMYEQLQKDFPNVESITKKYNLIVQEEENRKKEREQGLKNPKLVEEFKEEVVDTSVTNNNSLNLVRGILITIGLVLLICAVISGLRHKKIK
jgi:tetratricopeptide (TPR) repeat protein